VSPCDFEDFDWISARAQCEPFKVFERLRAQVKEDVAKRASLPTNGTHIAFSFEEGNDWITASKKILDKYEGVTFMLTPNGIAAHDLSNTFKHVGNLTISDEGRCMLRVDSRELYLWQFRKLALHDLFFFVRVRS
jgi:hypothetical protein